MDRHRGYVKVACESTILLRWPQQLLTATTGDVWMGVGGRIACTQSHLKSQNHSLSRFPSILIHSHTPPPQVKDSKQPKERKGRGEIHQRTAPQEPQFLSGPSMLAPHFGHEVWSSGCMMMSSVFSVCYVRRGFVCLIGKPGVVMIFWSGLCVTAGDAR